MNRAHGTGLFALRLTRSATKPIAQPFRLPIGSPTTAANASRRLAHRLAQPMTALRGGIELGLMGKRSAADYRSLLEQSLQLADNMAQIDRFPARSWRVGAPGGPSQYVVLGNRRPRKSWQKWRVWRNPGISVCNSRPKDQ